MRVGPSCRRLVAAAAVLAALGRLATAAPAPHLEATRELAAVMRAAGFSDSDLARVERGGVSTRILPQHEDNAAFVTGVTRVSTSATVLAERIRSIETFRSGGRTLQIGRFSTPPRAEDLGPLVIERKDLEALRACRPGDCDVKIGRAAMEAIRALDWKQGNGGQRAAEVVKKILAERVRTYMEQGPPGMAVYDDNDRPESVALGFEQILRDSRSLVDRAPDFFEYVLRFPHEPPLPEVENFFYWSKQKVREPVVSLVHVCLQRRQTRGDVSYLVAMKHIYDSHYFLAYGEFLTLLPAGDAGSSYLVRSIRALIDPPRGWFRGLLLGRIKSAMRDELARDLARTKEAFD
jgi:hypothetical protein